MLRRSCDPQLVGRPTPRDEGVRKALQQSGILTATAEWEFVDMILGMISTALPQTLVLRTPDTTGMNRHLRTTVTSRTTGETSSIAQIHLANVVDRARLSCETLEPRNEMTTSNLHYQKSRCQAAYLRHRVKVLTHQQLPPERRAVGRLASTATGLCRVRRSRLGTSIVCD
jgi:hypothetical protein